MNNTSSSPISLQPVAGSSVSLFRLLANRVLASRWIASLTAIYSDLLEEKIKPVQTLHLVHVQMAGFSALFPAALPLVVRFLLIAWFLLALNSCRRALTKA